MAGTSAIATICGRSPTRTGRYGNTIRSGTTSAVKPATSGRSGARCAREHEHADRQHDGAEHDRIGHENAADAAAGDPCRERGGRMESERVVIRNRMSSADVRRDNSRWIDRSSGDDAFDEPAVASRVRARGNERNAPQPPVPRRTRPSATATTSKASSIRSGICPSTGTRLPRCARQARPSAPSGVNA